MFCMSFVVGTWPLSGDLGHVSLTQIAATLRACVEGGLLEFDTAPSYGHGFMEFCLGKEIAQVSGVKLNTKFGNRPFLGKSFRIEDLRQSVDQSLIRLRIERIHVLFLHNPRGEVEDYDAVCGLFDELKRAGKIRQAGISLAKGLHYPFDLLSKFDVIQDDANILYQQSLGRAAKLPQVKFMARSPLATGLLGGRINDTTAFAADDQRSGWLIGERQKSLVRRVEAVRRVTTLPLPRLAMRFLLSHQAVSRVICGVKCPEHVRDLLDSGNRQPLDTDLRQKLQSLWERDFDLPDERHLGY
jgi:aryl-alcohol dehydrogenase-like predicted oxidoreductase